MIGGIGLVVDMVDHQRSEKQIPPSMQNSFPPLDQNHILSSSQIGKEGYQMKIGLGDHMDFGQIRVRGQ